MKHNDIGYDQAFQLAMDHVHPLSSERIPLSEACGRVAAGDICAIVDSPSIDASMKDGFAVVSGNIKTASATRPAVLKMIGQAAAGIESGKQIRDGETVRVLTGARIPVGADAVLADEFVARDGDAIQALADSSPGKNILPRGTDVKKGDILTAAGMMLSPQRMSLLAAGGVSEIPVCRQPKIGLLATGSEVLLPGDPMEEGKLFASNVVLQQGWLDKCRISCSVRHAGDAVDRLGEQVRELIRHADMVITSGGAWKGDRDLMVTALESMGWHTVFHRVRMGPGKAVGMGMLDDKPVFCLPGGPTSNEMAFLTIALPAILKMAGHRYLPFLRQTGILKRDIKGDIDWTQFVECRISQGEKGTLLVPEKMKSRLQSMAQTQAIVKIPEGTQVLPTGTRVPFICLDPDPFLAQTGFFL